VWRGGLLPDRAAGQSILVVDGVTDTGIYINFPKREGGQGGQETARFVFQRRKIFRVISVI
jgi:hypoxanthine phosphoribosyltransferase